MKKKPAPRTERLNPRKSVTAVLVRPWETMPGDAIIDSSTLARLAGVNIRTVQRHRGRGLLPRSSTPPRYTKRQADVWLKTYARHVRLGRPPGAKGKK